MSAEPQVPRQGRVEVVPTGFRPTGPDFRRHVTQRMNNPVANAALLNKVLACSGNGRCVVVVCGDARTARLVAIAAQLRGRSSEFLMGTSKRAHIRHVLELRSKFDVLSMTSATYSGFVHASVAGLFNTRNGYTDCMFTGMVGYVVGKLSKLLSLCRVVIVTDAVGTRSHDQAVSQLEAKFVRFAVTQVEHTDDELSLADTAMRVVRNYDGRVFDTADCVALASPADAGDAVQRAVAVVNLRSAAFVNNVRSALPSSLITTTTQVSGKSLALVVNIDLCE